MPVSNGHVSSHHDAQISIEVRLRPENRSSSESVLRSLVLEYIHNQSWIKNAHAIFVSNHENLGKFVDKLLVCQSGCRDGEIIHLEKSCMDKSEILTYKLEGEMQPAALIIDEGMDSTDESSVGSHQWQLPNAQFDDLWENLIFDDDVKSEVIDYMRSMLLLADSGVNRSIVTVNRMILFHGPPGTGKTSLCKALAQRLSIRMKSRFARSVFVEVNSHSLFSRWFSESGKLVQKMFSQISDLLVDSDCLVIVLIDEVESLTMARQGALNRNEPSDAIRVVNALLTQCDAIRSYPNVLILTTSNLSEAVDPAFVDRADLKRYIGPPSADAIYSIYSGIIQELQRTGMLQSNETLDGNKQNHELMLLAKRSVGLSGRSLRRLPVIAFAKLLKLKTTLEEFLNAMNAALDEQLEESLKLMSIKDK